MSLGDGLFGGVDGTVGVDLTGGVNLGQEEGIAGEHLHGGFFRSLLLKVRL